jgi:EAL domain-containing protein (putative c-di-GMP-specific phosphodiesterase class I)/GGDEF domain-containing protein
MKPMEPGTIPVPRKARRMDGLSTKFSYSWALTALSRWLSADQTVSRHCFLKQLESALAAQTPPCVTGVLVMSLSRSDSVDAILERPAADALRKRMLERIRSSLRQSDQMCLVSHDEIWVLLEKLPSPAIASLAANRAASELDTPFLVEGTIATVQPCIGIAVARDAGSTAQALLKAASLARNRARALGLPYFVAAADEYKEQISADLVRAVRYALEHNALSLAYQPKVGLQARDVVSVEALIRWPSTLQPVLTPTMLIDISEKFGLMQQLTRYVLHTALREHTTHLAQAGIRKIWINLSARMLSDPGLADFLMQALDVWGKPPEVLGLEITESTLITDIEQSVTMLDKLASLGFSLAIDDFGTGYSSLAYLRRLPINELKIDKLFVRHLPTSVPDGEIVRAIIDLAHHFKLDVVAEGVEDDVTLALLEKIGCDQVQGWVFAKGMSAAKAAEWCRSFSAAQQAGRADLNCRLPAPSPSPSPSPSTTPLTSAPHFQPSQGMRRPGNR